MSTYVTFHGDVNKVRGFADVWLLQRLMQLLAHSTHERQEQLFSVGSEVQQQLTLGVDATPESRALLAQRVKTLEDRLRNFKEERTRLDSVAYDEKTISDEAVAFIVRTLDEARTVLAQPLDAAVDNIGSLPALGLTEAEVTP